MKNTALLLMGLALGNFAVAQEAKPKKQHHDQFLEIKIKGDIPEPLDENRPYKMINLNRGKPLTDYGSKCNCKSLVVDPKKREIYFGTQEELDNTTEMLKNKKSDQAREMLLTLLYLNGNMVRNKTGLEMKDEELGEKFLIRLTLEPVSLWDGHMIDFGIMRRGAIFPEPVPNF